jgi:hypothetical protein
MDLFNRILTAVLDFVLHPFGQFAPIWGLVVVSFVAGAAMVWLFGRISNQSRVRTLKATMKGHLLEVWIFRDQLRNVVKAEGRVMRQTGKYILCSLPSFLLLMLPVVLLMTQLQARYGYRPLRPGEHVLVKVVLTDAPDHASANGLTDVKLQVPEGLVQETPALRIPRDREVDFRIAAAKPGRYQLVVEAAGETIAKSVDVGDAHISAQGPLSPYRSGSWMDRVLYPIEPGLPAGAVATVEIKYPEETVAFAGFQCSWIWPFLIISMAAGYALKGLFRVEL